jgi:type IV secretory pathway TrbL component
LGIALGLTQLPKKRGFAIMALGGLLIVIYAWALQIWVFFILNIVFFAANLLKLISIKKVLLIIFTAYLALIFIFSVVVPFDRLEVMLPEISINLKKSELQKR